MSFWGFNKDIGSYNHYGIEDFHLSVPNLQRIVPVSTLSSIWHSNGPTSLLAFVTIYPFNFSHSGESMMVSQYDLAGIFVVYNQCGRAIFICLLALG